MTRRRFYAPPEAFSSDLKVAQLSADETRHLRSVLRLNSGDEIYLFDGAGREFHGRVKTLARNSTEVTIVEQVEPARPESPLNLTLAIGLLKGEKFDLVIQKATELGVTRIVPVITARTDVKIHSEADAKRKTSRWQRIALEATKQCGRAVVMKIETPAAFPDVVKTRHDDLGIMFAECDGVPLNKAAGDSQTVIALVGPEGGWANLELAQACEAGWQIVTLGGRTMRAETAAIVIAALLQNRLGDLK